MQGRLAGLPGSQEIEWGKGEVLTAKSLAATWRKFAAEKFQATAAEAARPELPDIGPAEGRALDTLSLREKETALRILRKMKAPGRDGIPVEIYQNSPVCREKLFELADQMWRYELAPPEMVQGAFVCIFKNKGSSEDLTKYRFICLLSHASKLGR
jgi:hypothetical protein